MKKGFFTEFKEFISRGNVMDLAVGIIIGTAFTAIVNSIVNDVVMPLVGWIFGGINFTDLKYVIREATETAPEAALKYGNFIQSVVNFLLIAFVIFCTVKTINKFNEKLEKAKKALENKLSPAKNAEEAVEAAEEAAEEAPAEPSEEILLLREIRDSLKKD